MRYPCEIDKNTYQLSAMYPDDSEGYGLYSWPQSWPKTSGGQQGLGGNMMTKEQTYCFLRGNKCVVFFGDQYAYTADTRDWRFMDAFRKQNLPGVKTFEKVGYARWKPDTESDIKRKQRGI